MRISSNVLIALATIAVATSLVLAQYGGYPTTAVTTIMASNTNNAINSSMAVNTSTNTTASNINTNTTVNSLIMPTPTNTTASNINTNTTVNSLIMPTSTNMTILNTNVSTTSNGLTPLASIPVVTAAPTNASTNTTVRPSTVFSPSANGQFAWQGSGYYEIPAGSPNILATGMVPGVSYLITNPAFISSVNSWYT